MINRLLKNYFPLRKQAKIARSEARNRQTGLPAALFFGKISSSEVIFGCKNSF